MEAKNMALLDKVHSYNVRSVGASTGVRELNKLQGCHQLVIFSILLPVLNNKKTTTKVWERVWVCVLDREGNRVFVSRTLAVQPSWFARVNALHNHLCKKLRKVTAATSRPISKMASLHTVYNCGGWTSNCEAVQMPLLLRLQILQRKGDGGWKSVLELFFGILEHKQQVIVCFQTHSDYGPSKMHISWHCKLCKFTVIAFHCEESTHRKWCWVKVKGINSPTWTTSVFYQLQ